LGEIFRFYLLLTDVLLKYASEKPKN